MLVYLHFLQMWLCNAILIFCFMVSLMLTEQCYIINHIFILMQISVPHNESDKLPRGSLDKMTLIEV